MSAIVTISSSVQTWSLNPAREIPRLSLLRNNRLRFAIGWSEPVWAGESSDLYDALLRQLAVAGGFYARRLSVSLERKTAPVTKPANAGKINANVQPWTLPMEFSSQTEMPLVSQQSAPLTLVWATSNRCLSKNEPTIASTVPTSSEGINTLDSTANSQSCEFSKLCLSNRAYRNTPPMLKIAPIGNTHLNSLNRPPNDGNNLHRFDNCRKQAMSQACAVSSLFQGDF